MRLAIAAAFLATPALAAPDPAKIYAENCARCHQLDGRGLAGAYPALAGDKIAAGPAAAAIRLVLNGKGEMPGFGNRMTDEEMAAALSYARNSWGNMAGPVKAEDVDRVRSARK